MPEELFSHSGIHTISWIFSYLPFGGGPRKCVGDMFATFEVTFLEFYTCFFKKKSSFYNPNIPFYYTSNKTITAEHAHFELKINIGILGQCRLWWQQQCLSSDLTFRWLQEHLRYASTSFWFVIVNNRTHYL